MSDLLEPLSTSEYIIDEILRYGLFLGAIFQIVCIAAAIWLPAKEGEVEEAPQKGGPTAPPRHKGKHNDKKKRR